MKKIQLFFAAVIICTASASAYNCYLNSVMTEEEKMFIKNVEALSRTEDSATCTFSEVYKNQAENKLQCRGNGSLCCKM